MKKLNIQELGRMSQEQFKLSRKVPVIIVLDNVRSIYNVGSIFRTADAFRIECICLCGITSTPVNSLIEIHKTALGAEDTVEWSYYKDTANAVNELKNNGYSIIAVEQVKDSKKLNDLKIEYGKYALIFGNEVKGVSQEVVDMCDYSIEIPQFGTKHSLNVSVSAGMVMWEFIRQLMEYIE